jgi:trans-aconitate 2-methyltransferase
LSELQARWDPAQYLRFSQSRLRPALELLSRVELEAPGVIYDLGCGTGVMTRLMAERWPQAQVTGVDASGEMLRATSSARSNLHWQQQDIGAWRAASAPDLIFSNAALHWLTDHEQLLRQLLSCLAPRGVLAVQMPRNFSAASHVAIGETVRDGPWRARLEPLLRDSPVADPQWYLDLLSAHCEAVDVWQTQYFQILYGDNPVKEWTKGTWLAPLLAALPEQQRPLFEQAYAERVARAYPRRTDGSTVFPFQRLFFVARRAH